MKRPAFVPSHVSLLCGVLLFMLLGVFSMAASAVVPFLLELLQEEPRLAMIGFLGLVMSPAAVVVLAHHIGHRMIDGADVSAKKSRGFFPKLVSYWAGAHAWMVLYASSVFTSLIMLIIHPPERDEAMIAGVGSAVLSALKPFVFTSLSSALSLHAIVWVLVASQLFELERRARSS